MLGLMSASSAAPKPTPSFEYNAARDTLNVNVNDTTLSRLLRQISLKSGLEILFDMEAERNISIHIKDQPMERALKRILRDTNYVMIFGKKRLLVAVKVLPKGKQDSDSLKSVASLKSIGLVRAQDNHRTKKKGNHELSTYREQRWQSAMANLTPELKTKIEKFSKEHEDRLNKMDKLRKQSSDRRKQQQAKRNKIRMEREALFRSGNPEEFDRKRAEAKANIAAEIERRKAAME